MFNFLNPAQELSLADWGLRTISVGIEIYILGRYLPRRSGGPYAAYDFAFFWMMGGLAASPLFDSKIGFLPTIVAVATIYTLHYGLSILSTKSRTFAKVLMGEPVVLISKGKIIRENMAKSLMPVEILQSELRAVNVFNFDEIEYAILETSGHISVIKKGESGPVTPKDINIQVQNAPAPLIVINDGNIIEENIKKLGFSTTSFLVTLEEKSSLVPKQIFLATMDAAGNMYFSGY